MNKNIFICGFCFILLLLSVPATAEEAAAPDSVTPMTWDDCVKEAAKNNPGLVSAQQSIKSSQADKKISASGLFPQISTDFNATKSKSSGGSSSGGLSGGSTGAVNNYNYGVTGNQLLFDGFQTINKVNAAGENIKAAQQSYNFTSSQVRQRLRAAFVNLLRAQESVKISQEIYERRRQNYELVTLRYESGRENKGSLLTEGANVRQAQYDISVAKRNVDLARRQLTKEMGLLQLVPVEAEGDFIVKDPAREKPDFISLAANHPSLQQLIAQKNAAIYNVKTAKGEFLPTITAQGSANKSDTRWPPGGNQWSIGAAVSFPIFEGGKRFADVSKANALLAKAEADERNSRDGIIQSLTDAWTSLQNALENVEVQGQFLTASEERAKITEAQYSIGFVSFNDWIIIENNLVSAKQSYLNAQAQALTNEANWIQAKGETLENIE
ncbi:MAG: TolC family protein [Candidatus Omnitrophica bacterium]|nr:TolC family protein [Candidatus Omnitrophota bacterium]MDD5311200.1 TolC family protein [Candidatus Omnitrophota bacterium]MDD5546133.1 TolC family protein [Candidatus Omnitrophota bacterium]